MQRNLRALLRDERGHATAETVIMLPAFIIIWGCVLFTAKAYEKTLELGQETRQDAWRKALLDCDPGVRPETALRDASSSPLGDAFGDILEQVDAVIETLPFLGEYWPGLTFDEFEASRRGRLERPRVLGEGESRFGHAIVLMCNEKRTEVNLDDMTNQAWGIFGF